MPAAVVGFIGPATPLAAGATRGGAPGSRRGRGRGGIRPPFPSSPPPEMAAGLQTYLASLQDAADDAEGDPEFGAQLLLAGDGADTADAALVAGAEAVASVAGV